MHPPPDAIVQTAAAWVELPERRSAGFAPAKAASELTVRAPSPLAGEGGSNASTQKKG
jgi:hypothetical protein